MSAPKRTRRSSSINTKGVAQSMRFVDCIAAGLLPLSLSSYRAPCSVTDISWSPNETHLAFGDGTNDRLCLFDVRSCGSVSTSPIRCFPHCIHKVQWHPKHETLLATGSSIPNVTLWDPRAGLKTTSSFPLSDGDDEDEVTSMAWNPLGSELSVATSEALCTIDTRCKNKVHIMFNDYSDAMIAMEWSPCGKYLATGSLQGIVAIWCTRTRKKVCSDLVESRIKSIAWSPCGRKIALGCYHINYEAWSTINMWQFDGSSLIDVVGLSEFEDSMIGVTWSQCGSTIATLSVYNELHMIDADKRVVATFDGKPVSDDEDIDSFAPPVKTIDLEGGRSNAAGGFNVVKHIEWSPSGTTLAYHSQSNIGLIHF